jgi:hypothetical protein
MNDDVHLFTGAWPGTTLSVINSQSSRLALPAVRPAPMG